jgi:hypothetical protein
VNSANVSGLDFGILEGLTSISPAVAFQGQTINANVTSRSLFATGANPWGNINYAALYNNTIYASAFHVIDSVNAPVPYPPADSSTLLSAVVGVPAPET